MVKRKERREGRAARREMQELALAERCRASPDSQPSGWAGVWGCECGGECGCVGLGVYGVGWGVGGLAISITLLSRLERARRHQPRRVGGVGVWVCGAGYVGLGVWGVDSPEPLGCVGMGLWGWV